MEKSMKKLFWLIAFLSSMAAAQGSLEAISLLCVADKSTGFKYRAESQEWDATTFNVSSNRYTFAKSDDGVYEFRKFGDRYPVSTCETINEYGFGQCTDSIYELTINVRSLRYLLIYPVGFAVAPEAMNESGKAPGDAPHMEIGVCTRL
jgi:hypothetical protein